MEEFDVDFGYMDVEDIREQFEEEVDGLLELAHSLGEDNNLSQRLLRTSNNLKSMHWVFMYAIYTDRCASRTPKIVREICEKTFKYKEEIDLIRCRLSDDSTK